MIALRNRNITDLSDLRNARGEEREAIVAITELDISHNMIESFAPGKPLATDEAEEEEDEEGEEDDFQDGILPSLAFMDVSFNHVESLRGMKLVAPNIAKLCLSHNHLTTLKGLEHCTALTYLDVCDNRLQSLDGLPLPYEDQTAPPHAKYGVATIKAANNLITNIAALTISSMRQVLQVLDLSNNKLSNPGTLFAVTECPCLRLLCLKDNDVAMLDSTPSTLKLLLPAGCTALLGQLGEVRGASKEDKQTAAEAQAESSTPRSGRASTQPPSTPPSVRGAVSDVQQVRFVDAKEHDFDGVAPEPSMAVKMTELPHSQPYNASKPSRGSSPDVESTTMRLGDVPSSATAIQRERELLTMLSSERNLSSRLQAELQKVRHQLRDARATLACEVNTVREQKAQMEWLRNALFEAQRLARKRVHEHRNVSGQLRDAQERVVALSSRVEMMHSSSLNVREVANKSVEDADSLRQLCQEQQAHIDSLSDENNTLVQHLERLQKKHESLKKQFALETMQMVIHAQSAEEGDSPASLHASQLSGHDDFDRTRAKLSPPRE